jgi:hypothetical protein
VLTFYAVPSRHPRRNRHRLVVMAEDFCKPQIGQMRGIVRWRGLATDGLRKRSSNRGHMIHKFNCHLVTSAPRVTKLTTYMPAGIAMLRCPVGMAKDFLAGARCLRASAWQAVDTLGQPVSIIPDPHYFDR